MAGIGGHTEGGRYKPQVGAQMSSPNIIPMADIMLVLLIIFMVVTPMLQKNKSYLQTLRQVVALVPNPRRLEPTGDSLWG